MLQIEIVWGDVGGLSKSVTSEADFAELLLQIEIFGGSEESSRQNHHKGACLLCGGFDV